MLPTPKKFTIVVGRAEGPTWLNAFDNALLDAGIGNLNLIKVSSVLPPEARYVERLEIAPGSLTPTAYGYVTSDVPGDTIAAAVGIGFSEDTFGIIMEHAGRCTQKEAEAEIGRMLKAAFERRELRLARTMIKGVEHKVHRLGCAFSAVALWY